MEDKTSFIAPLFERAEAYGKVSYKLLQIKALDKTASVVATLVSRSVAIIFTSIFFVSANIGIALWLGDLLGKSYYGFFCVAGFYGLIGAILHFLLHSPIKRWISNSIISQALD